MKIKFDDIMEAFFFVNEGGLANHTAVLDNSTGKVYWQSEDSEINEIPEGLLDSKDAIEIPQKNELCLGTDGNESQEKAVREWCKDSEVKLID